MLANATLPRPYGRAPARGVRPWQGGILSNRCTWRTLLSYSNFPCIHSPPCYLDGGKLISMKKLLIAQLAIMLGLASTAAYSVEGWVDLIDDKEEKIWSVKKGSFSFSRTKEDKPMAMVIGRSRDINTKKVDFYRWYVTANDCYADLGELVVLDLQGDVIIKIDFVIGGGSVSSLIAEFICKVANAEIEKRN